jgi:hypothetical protein|tara:strand:- start:354 stop:542 length:189 start_codon:yes stop_codon:yes gene_type:complete
MNSDALIHSTLSISGDVSGYPVSHPFVVNIRKFRNKMLVGFEIIGELVWIHLNQSKGPGFNE